MKIPLSKIIIGERQRIDLGDPLNDLDSMGDPDVGQINPILVERQLDGQYLLVAGRRRLEYAIRAGWKEIAATERTGMTELQKQKVEFLEDYDRKDRNWFEGCLAIAKLHKMLKRERAQEIGKVGWSIRAMSKFTGIGKSRLDRMLDLAEALTANPDDKELRDQPDYTTAHRLLVERSFKLANDELERRRLAQKQFAIQEVTPPERTVGKEEPIEETKLSYVPQGDITEIPTPALEPAVQRPVIYICGHNMHFEDAVLDVDYIANFTVALLSEPNDETIDKSFEALKDGGYLIIWQTGPTKAFTLTGRLHMPQPLIWNKVETELQSPWPWADNTVNGLVIRKGETPPAPTDNPSGSVISCNPYGPDLPAAVVDFSLRPVCPEGLPVLLPSNAPVLAVAESGRIPIWFEPDRMIFDAKVADLKAFYESTIPNVEVRVRE